VLAPRRAAILLKNIYMRNPIILPHQSGSACNAGRVTQSGGALSKIGSRILRLGQQCLEPIPLAQKQPVIRATRVVNAIEIDHARAFTPG
jgi:uncharacterized protein (DUF779 family)